MDITNECFGRFLLVIFLPLTYRWITAPRRHILHALHVGGNTHFRVTKWWKEERYGVEMKVSTEVKEEGKVEDFYSHSKEH